VEQLDLSVRTMNCLRRSNITTVGELIGKGAKELMKLRNFGQKSYQEIEDRLETIGLSLNPKSENEVEEEPGETPRLAGRLQKEMDEGSAPADNTDEEE
jgi:DNA-directed RNA polymerase alpha subunit